MRNEWIDDMSQQYLEDMIEGEPVMTLAEYTVTCDDEPLTDEEYAAIMG